MDFAAESTVGLKFGPSLAAGHIALVFRYLDDAPLAEGCSCHSCQEPGQANEVVGHQGQGEGGIHASPSPQFHLRQSGRTLDPTKHLFDALTAALAGRVAGMARGATINRGGARLAPDARMAVNGDVRRDPAAA